MPSRWAAVFAAALLIVCCSRPGLGQPSTQARQWAAEAVRELDLQTELPRRGGDREPASVRLPPEVVWLPVLGGFAVLAFYFVNLLPGWRLAGGADWGEWSEAADGAAATQTAEDAISAAEALSRQGRFAEAMHLTLLGSVAAIRRQLGEEIADSLTSREILRSRRLPDAGRGFLREIVGRVERSHFGRYPTSLGDYAACRSAFDELLQVLARGQGT